jgi:hypothetical protein
MIVLDELHRESCGRESCAIEAFQKKATLVAEHFGLEQLDVGDPGRDYDHGRGLSRRISGRDVTEVVILDIFGQPRVPGKPRGRRGS